MAKVKNHLVSKGLSGKVGKRLVFRQLRDGSTILCTAPDFSHRVFSEEQVTHQSRFKQVLAYAELTAKAMSLYAKLAPTRNTNAYHLALSDWFNLPVIQ